MRRASLAAGLLSILLLPGGTFASGALEIADSVAGLSLNIDIYGATPKSGYTVEIHAPDGSVQKLPTQTDAQGAAEVTLRGERATRSGTYSALLLQGDQPTGTQASFVVYPDEPSASISNLATDRSSIQADGSDSAAVAVHLTDRFGNGIPDRPLALVPGRQADTVASLDAQTDSDGWQRFYVTTKQPGTITLRATDLVSGLTLNSVLSILAVGPGSSIGGDDAPVFLAQVTSPTNGLVDRFEVVLPATMQAGIEAQTFTVRAVDKDGAIVPDYVNRVRFRSSDPLAELPGLDDTYKFTPKDQGSKTFALALKLGTPGVQTVTVEDSNDSSIKGSTSVSVTGDGQTGGGGTITIDSPTEASTVKGPTITLLGKGPVLANITASGGLTPVKGATTNDGSFALTITVPTSGTDLSLSVSDESGRYRSPTLHLKLDNEAPVIDLVTYTPERPAEGQEVTASLKTAATDVGSAALKITDSKNASITLTLAPMGSALYQGKFTAGPAGKYQVLATAVDLVGNTGSSLSNLGIRPLPPSNIQVTPKGQLMSVTWTGSTSSVDGYRIYIGEKIGDWSSALDTRQSASPLTTTASVKDLEPGKSYAFAVSAVLGELESDLSPAAQQLSLGLGLDIAPADGALLLKWNSLPQAIPITSYDLRFGLKKDALTEQRILPATTKTGNESYVISDLINGMTYYVSLTPIAGNNPITELSALGQGTPDGQGRTLPGSSVSHGGAPLPPSNTGSGPNGWIWWAIAAAGLVIGAVQWAARRRARLSFS